jgi:hypothetical protein
MAVVLLPLTPGLTSARIFYIRDLSLYFWGRHLWLRHAWQSGAFPLWDPYVGAGQDAVSDPLNQMFLLPAVLVRLIGSDVLGFNLWVAAPFPLAALGTWLFLSRRFSAVASALAAVAFALCGPVYSTTNFPNMSWAVAAIPWTLWAADRLVSAPSARRLAVLAVMVAAQALAGEAVTMIATLGLTVAYGWTFAMADIAAGWRARAVRGGWVCAGLALGLAIGAVQLAPMIVAAPERKHILNNPLFWSLHPLALLETLTPRLFGDYYVSQSLASIPWAPLVNSGREPFFFSLYVGVPLLCLATLGLVAGGPRRWATFWALAALVALVGAFGAYTPVYPFMSRLVPPLQSLRFPAKYAVIAAMALAALTAAGWDAVRTSRSSDVRWRRGRVFAIALAAITAGLASAAVAWCVFFPTSAAFRFFAIARGLRSTLPVEAAEYMLRAVPEHATGVVSLAMVSALAMFLATAGERRASVGRGLLLAVIVADLAARAWPINPTFDPTYLAQPVWVSAVQADPHARFYIGGKREGTLDSTDPDASRAFVNPPGLIGSASRAALSAQTAFYPSAWRVREMLSYDLTAIWSRLFDVTSRQFLRASPDERDRFLRRTGVRFRILPAAIAGDRTPIVAMPYYVESYVYDWGADGVAPRVTVRPRARIEPDVARQVDALFAADWDDSAVLVTHETAAFGREGRPEARAARVVVEDGNRLTVEAIADERGGYLVVLDTFANGWSAEVDGVPAEILRANGLFRAVRLAPGRHHVRFAYRPVAMVWGGGLSAFAVALVIGLLVRRPRVSDAVGATAPASAVPAA